MQSGRQAVRPPRLAAGEAVYMSHYGRRAVRSAVAESVWARLGPASAWLRLAPPTGPRPARVGRAGPCRPSRAQVADTWQRSAQRKPGPRWGTAGYRGLAT